LPPNGDIDDIGAVVLAAGRSSRMGPTKLLLPLGDRTVLAHVVSAVEASRAAPVVVVLGHEADAVLASLPAGRWVGARNGDYAAGMASSLRVGVRALATQQRPCAALRGALVLLGDMPLVTTAIIDAVFGRARAQPARIVAASYDGARRHPVYFPRELFGELAQLEGDEGGRSLLARHPDVVELVAVQPAAAALDVDTPQDYARVLDYWNARHSAEGD